MIANLSTSIVLIVFVVATTANNYTWSVLAFIGIGTSQALVFRGVSCLIFTILLSRCSRESLVACDLRSQLVRFSLAGLGTWAVAESYRSGPVSKIALISRIDIPLLVLFGSYASMIFSKLKKVFSLLALSVICSSMYPLSQRHSYSLVMALIGTILLGICFLIMKRTATTENASVMVLTPALACIAVGSLSGGLPYRYELSGVIISILSGLLMVVSYHFSRQLYIRTTFLRAQGAYILIPMLSIPIDIVIFDRSFAVWDTSMFCLVSGAILLLCYMPERSNDLHRGDRNESAKVKIEKGYLSSL